MQVLTHISPDYGKATESAQKPVSIMQRSFLGSVWHTCFQPLCLVQNSGSIGHGANPHIGASLAPYRVQPIANNWAVRLFKQSVSLYPIVLKMRFNRATNEIGNIEYLRNRWSQASSQAAD